MNPADPDTRRQAILASALRTADRRRRQRTATRTLAAAAVVGIVVSTFTLMSQRKEHQHPAPIAESPRPAPASQPASAPAAEPMVVVRIIRETDIQPRWKVLSDEQFLAALAAAGQPSGFIQLNGKSVIVPEKEGGGSTY